MTLKHVLKYFSKKSEDLGAKGSFAIAQDDEESYGEGFVIQRAKPEESHAQEVLRFAQDDGRFSGEGCKELPSPVAFATQSLKCRKTRHFDKMLKQVQHDNFSCAKHIVKDLSSNRPTVLTTLKKAAFTLAEVLITLGIIGVVAAMTLPTLIQNHQKQAYVTGLKKAYANLQNAFAKMAYDEGVTDWSQTYCGDSYWGVWGRLQEEECFNRLKKQFNVVKSEHFENFDDHYREDLGYAMSGYFYTNDGMTYLFDCSGGIYVDVNGDKGPNKSGRDIFSFQVRFDQNKLRPGSYAAKVLTEGKMDY